MGPQRVQEGKGPSLLLTPLHLWSTDHTHLRGKGQAGLAGLTGSCPRGLNPPRPLGGQVGASPGGLGWDPGPWIPEAIARALRVPAGPSQLSLGRV